MIGEAEKYQAAVKLLVDLPPYEKCRHLVQMVYDGTLTREQGLELLHRLVKQNADAPTLH
jgi:hypothetical protein